MYSKCVKFFIMTREELRMMNRNIPNVKLVNIQ